MPRYKLIENSVVVALTEEEEAELAVWESEADDRAADNIRSERDEKLKATDWRACSDLTLSTEWATYRQALRDITTQEGFPNSVVWPTEPGE